MEEEITVYAFLVSVQKLLNEIRPALEYRGTMTPAERVALDRAVLDKVNTISSTVDCLVGFYEQNQTALSSPAPQVKRKEA